MYDAAPKRENTATDLADYLVRKGCLFVMPMMQWDVQLQRQTRAAGFDRPVLDTLQKFSEKIDADVFQVLTLEGSVARAIILVEQHRTEWVCVAEARTRLAQR
ncbi:MAG: hypothetical protein Ct9H300mP14_03290 [Gammaproteobacteria bacterium]|nr:MAG: hypothetical protein Ct9H300mP14_03290 [Gammaproteobacteria bacterium]